MKGGDIPHEHTEEGVHICRQRSQKWRVCCKPLMTQQENVEKCCRIFLVTSAASAFIKTIKMVLPHNLMIYQLCNRHNNESVLSTVTWNLPSRTKWTEPSSPPYRLQLLLLLDQELQHQVDICQVQVLLVRIQGILEYLPPRPVLDIRGAIIKAVMAPRLNPFNPFGIEGRGKRNVQYLQDGLTSVASPRTFVSVSGSAHLLWGRRRWKWQRRDQEKKV